MERGCRCGPGCRCSSAGAVAVAVVAVAGLALAGGPRGAVPAARQPARRRRAHDRDATRHLARRRRTARTGRAWRPGVARRFRWPAGRQARWRQDVGPTLADPRPGRHRPGMAIVLPVTRRARLVAAGTIGRIREEVDDRRPSPIGCSPCRPRAAGRSRSRSRGIRWTVPSAQLGVLLIARLCRRRWPGLALLGRHVARAGLAPVERLTGAVEHVADTQDLRAADPGQRRRRDRPAGALVQRDARRAGAVAARPADACRGRRARAAHPADQHPHQHRAAARGRRQPGRPGAVRRGPRRSCCATCEAQVVELATAHHRTGRAGPRGRPARSRSRRSTSPTSSTPRCTGPGYARPGRRPSSRR